MDKEYEYSGPVTQFNRCIERNWKASTTASSKKKALNNLVFRYKREHNMISSANIKLQGTLTEVKRKENTTND